MPDNHNSGELEDFVEYLIRDQDYLWEHAKVSVDSIDEDEIRFGNDKQKAYVHTWLAWQDEPGISIGQAIAKQCLNPHCPEAQAFIEWVKRLAE